MLASTASAATLYWDGADSGANAQGGAGTWIDDSGTTQNWDTLAFGGTDSAWTNTNLDTAVFGGTADTVTIGTGGVTAGGLRFDTTGYILDASSNALAFGAGNNLIGFSQVSGATITGSVSGSGNVETKMVNPVIGTTLTPFTLTLNGTSTGGWSGATTVGPLSTLSLAESNQALLNTSGITLNGGNITLTNADGTEGALDRISDSAPITSKGSTITYTNTAGSGIVHAESIGDVTLSGGQTFFVLTTNQNGGSGNMQTLTLNSLTQSGTSNAMFSGVSTTTAGPNLIRVPGITTSMTGNEIIGPWATISNASGTVSDFARYVSDTTDGFVVAANIAKSDEDTWTSSAEAYNALNGTSTLTGTRTMMGLRLTVTNSVVELGDFNLETHAIIHAAANAASVKATVDGASGWLTTPSGGGNLCLTGNSNAFRIEVPIKDNSGAVTVVKFGNNINSTSLNGILSNSGGVVVNGGKLSLNNSSNTFTGGVFLGGDTTLSANPDARLGDASNSITLNGNATLAFGNGTYPRNIILNNGALAIFNNSSPIISGNVTGTGGLGMNSTGTTQPQFNGTANTFEGPILIGGSGSTNQAYRFRFNSLADSATANGRIVFVANSTTSTDGSAFEYNGSTHLSLDNRVIEIASNGDTPTNGHQIRSNGAGTLSINSDLLVTSTTAQTLALKGSNTGDNTFGGVISNGASSAVSLLKADAGTWVLSGPNTYTGGTTITAGTLALGATNVLPDASDVSIGAATLDAATFTDTLGTLDVTGAATINLGVGGALAFAASNGVDWTGGTLNITVGTLGATSIRFGTDANGLTTDQKNAISVNGSGAGTYTLDSSGYLVSGGGGDDYNTWATDNGIDGEPFDGDFNNDGISNGVAYALGKSPTASSQPAGVLSGDTITFTKGSEAITNADVSWIIETSETLAPDSWIDAVTQAAGDATATISYTFTPGAPAKKFARLKAVQTP